MSTISFNCPNCGKPFRTAASNAGREGKCPKCTGVVIVPAADLQPELFADRQPEPKPEPQPVDVTPVTIGTCPFCSRDMYPSEDILECISCNTSHHLECWNEHQGCTNRTCTMAPPDRERASYAMPGGGMTLQPAMAMAGTAGAAAIPRTLPGTKTRAEGAMASLVFGILGFFICGFVFGWMAISNANKAKKDIAADPERYSGGGLATAGLIMGVLDIVLWAAYIASRASG